MEPTSANLGRFSNTLTFASFGFQFTTALARFPLVDATPTSQEESNGVAANRSVRVADDPLGAGQSSRGLSDPGMRNINVGWNRPDPIVLMV